MDKVLMYLGGTTLLGYLVLLLWRPSAAAEGLDNTFEMLWQAAPWIIVSMFTAGLISQIVRPSLIARYLGPQAGLLGIFIAAVIGIFGTGSKWAVYPLAAGLLAANATPGAVFSFMTTWQLVSLPRLPAELPFLGMRFTVSRVIVSILISFIGGILVNILWERWPPE